MEKYLTTNQTTKEKKILTKYPKRPIYFYYITPGIPNPREYLVLLPKRQNYTFAVSPRPFSDGFRLHRREEWEVNTASSLQDQCPMQYHTDIQSYLNWLYQVSKNNLGINTDKQLNQHSCVEVP